MHPSLQGKYNLRSADDVALADLFLAAAKKSNLSDAQAPGLLQFYSTVAPALERGQLTRDDALAQLKDYAALQGVGSDECTALLGWRGKTEAYIDTPGELPER